MLLLILHTHRMTGVIRFVTCRPLTTTLTTAFGFSVTAAQLIFSSFFSQCYFWYTCIHVYTWQTVSTDDFFCLNTYIFSLPNYIFVFLYRFFSSFLILSSFIPYLSAWKNFISKSHLLLCGQMNLCGTHCRVYGNKIQIKQGPNVLASKCLNGYTSV